MNLNDLSQPLTQEQLDEQRAFNRASQFFDKSNALGHAPTAQPVVASEPDALGWRHIDSAPKDGTPVLLIATRHSMLMPNPQRVVGTWRQVWWSGSSTLSHVTHWMPLPDMPPAPEAPMTRTERLARLHAEIDALIASDSDGGECD